MPDEQSFALHHHFYLTEIIANEGRTTADDIEDTIGKTDARTDFHRTSDDMNLSINTFLCHELTEDVGIGSGNLLTIKPLHALIVDFFRDGKGETAFGKTQTRNNLRILTTLYKFVFTHYADICHTTGYTLWDVVITQI